MKPNIRSVDLNLLVAFDALYEDRNVTRAAERLSLTQPTVSGMLKRLRDLFGDDLFVRTSHGIVPTPRADDLAKRARDIIEAAEMLLVDTPFDPARDTASVTLCGSDYLNQTLLAALASRIMAKAPLIHVSVITPPDDRIATRMARGEIDLFFSTGDKAGLDLQPKVLFRDHLVCLSSFKDHHPGQAIALDKICKLPHIKILQAATAMSTAIDHALSARGARRNVAVHVPNIATLAQVMAATELVCFLPQSMVRLLGPSVKVLAVDLNVPPVDIAAFWHPRLDGDPRHLWLRQMLAEAVAQHTADRSLSGVERP